MSVLEKVLTDPKLALFRKYHSLRVLYSILDGDRPVLWRESAEKKARRNLELYRIEKEIDEILVEMGVKKVGGR